MISEYADLLARELRFDRALSQCVRQEVEAHLWEAVAADTTADIQEAQRRAIAKFGDPHAIAAQFVTASLARQTRRLGAIATLTMAGVYFAMKARVAWYGATQLSIIGDDLRTTGGIIARVDGYAFWLSVAAAIGAWIYISSRHIPAGLNLAYRKALHRFFTICAAATAALIISVASDGVLTALRLFERGWSTEFLLPFASMAVEVLCAGALVFLVRTVTRRSESAMLLPKS